MKKFKIAALVLALCLFITGCGCSKKASTYTVKFDTDGGSKVTAQEIKKGKTVEEPDDPTKKGYIFDGWYIDDEEYDFDDEVTKNITLKAKWVKKASGENACTLTCEEGYELSKDCSCKKISSSKPTGTPQAKPVGGKENTSSGGNSGNNEKSTIEEALGSIKSLTLTKGNTSLSQSYSGCTIVNTENTVSSNASATVIEGEKVTKLYRPIDGGTITSKYTVTCGNDSSVKTVTHEIEASDYTYTVTDNNVVYIIKVKDAENYTLNGNLKYRSTIGGAQTGLTNYKSGKIYKMTFDNDLNTTYEVKEA